MLCFLCLAFLSACGGDATPSDLESDIYITAPVEAPVQEEIPEQTAPPARPPLPILVSIRHVSVQENRERYTLHQVLYEGGEEIAVHWDATILRQGDMRTYDDGSEVFVSDRWIGYNGIITVENSTGEIIMRFEHPTPSEHFTDEENHATWLPPSHSIGYPPPLFFADLNFDGYQDLVISVFTGGMAIPTRYYGFIWYPELGRFVEAESFSRIFNFWLDEELQALRSSYRRGPSQIWRYIDGDFVVTNELSFSETSYLYYLGELWANYFIDSDGFPRIIRYERHLVNGELVDRWPIISDTEEGRAIIYEHLFGENSIWFPRRPAQDDTQAE